MAEAYEWYEDRAIGLGAELLDSVELVFNAIAENPMRYPIIHRTVRRAVTRRFPYGVFYVVSDSSISVIAVMHSRRNPSRWQERI